MEHTVRLFLGVCHYRANSHTHQERGRISNRGTEHRHGMTQPSDTRSQRPPCPDTYNNTGKPMHTYREWYGALTCRLIFLSHRGTLSCHDI